MNHVNDQRYSLGGATPERRQISEEQTSLGRRPPIYYWSIPSISITDSVVWGSNSIESGLMYRIAYVYIVVLIIL